MKKGLHKLQKIKKTKKRIGRGIANKGSKSGRGMKGQKSRAGYSRRAGFEGGQTPLFQRLPKKRGAGRSTTQGTKYIELRVKDLKAYADGDIVGPGALKKRGLSLKKSDRVKLIGAGELVQKLTIRVHAVTEGARKIVEGAGGKVEIITRKVKNGSKKV